MPIQHRKVFFSDAVWNGNRVNVEISQAPGTKSSRGGGSRDGGRSYSGGGDRKRKSTGSRDRKSRNSKKRVRGRSSGGNSSSFKGRFKEASKRRGKS